ncbi:MAG: hypothetical protein EOO56_08865 [Hymenobacter sp.]|nr:MAG: hypothetical protein EOO56_08865 [Hymenobacter sp.]
MAKANTPSRADLQKLADSRLQEAKVLLANHLPDGAVYLAGYALELAFKARICKLLDSDYPSLGEEFRSFRTHKYLTLLKLAGLENQLLQKQTQDPAFKTSWSILLGASPEDGWSENWRYRKLGSTSTSDAQSFIKALEDTQSGILTWLKTLW